MRTVIDQVLTPEFLNEAGMKPGTVVDVEVHNGAISIVSTESNFVQQSTSDKPIDESANHLVEENGMLVFTGKIDPNFSFEEFSKQMREERDRKVMGI